MRSKTNDTLNAELLVKGLREAADTAYRGVIKPVEGTILTVAREAAEEAERAYQDTQDMIDDPRTRRRPGERRAGSHPGNAADSQKSGRGRFRGQWAGLHP